MLQGTHTPYFPHILDQDNSNIIHPRIETKRHQTNNKRHSSSDVDISLCLFFPSTSCVLSLYILHLRAFTTLTTICFSELEFQLTMSWTFIFTIYDSCMRGISICKSLLAHLLHVSVAGSVLSTTLIFFVTALKGMGSSRLLATLPRQSSRSTYAKPTTVNTGHILWQRVREREQHNRP